MGDWGSEYESAYKLADEVAQELLGLDPTNELLWLWFEPPEGIEDPFESEKERNEAMKNRFWNRRESWEEQPKTIVSTVVMSNYYLAVKQAINEIAAGVPSS